jgi:hypothetical protein
MFGGKIELTWTTSIGNGVDITTLPMLEISYWTYLKLSSMKGNELKERH